MKSLVVQFSHQIISTDYLVGFWFVKNSQTSFIPAFADYIMTNCISEIAVHVACPESNRLPSILRWKWKLLPLLHLLKSSQECISCFQVGQILIPQRNQFESPFGESINLARNKTANALDISLQSVQRETIAFHNQTILICYGKPRKLIRIGEINELIVEQACWQHASNQHPLALSPVVLNPKYSFDVDHQAILASKIPKSKQVEQLSKQHYCQWVYPLTKG